MDHEIYIAMRELNERLNNVEDILIEKFPDLAVEKAKTEYKNEPRIKK